MLEELQQNLFDNPKFNMKNGLFKKDGDIIASKIDCRGKEITKSVELMNIVG